MRSNLFFVYIRLKRAFRDLVVGLYLKHIRGGLTAIIGRLNLMLER